MEVLVFLMLLVVCVLIYIPTKNEKSEFVKYYNGLRHCDVHTWIKKPSYIEGYQYTVCKDCRYLPESDDYEP